jgi:hypothetical protein
MFYKIRSNQLYKIKWICHNIEWDARCRMGMSHTFDILNQYVWIETVFNEIEQVCCNIKHRCCNIEHICAGLNNVTEIMDAYVPYDC